VVIIPDIWGLRPLFVDHAERIANQWNARVAVFEPFGNRSMPPIDDGIEPRAQVVSELDDLDLIADAHEAASLLETERTCILGFCLGGMYAMKAAGAGRFDRAVSFYGQIRLPDAWKGPGQREPLSWMAEPGRCPLFSVLGGLDSHTPPDAIAELSALPDVTIALYAEADHGFVHDPSRPSHRADDAADAWLRVHAFITE